MPEACAEIAAVSGSQDRRTDCAETARLRRANPGLPDSREQRPASPGAPNARDQALHMRDRRLLQDAVTKIEDERFALQRDENFIHRVIQSLAARDQDERIEISLH